jgi:hypothetical protein
MWSSRLFKYPALVMFSASSFLPFSKKINLHDQARNQEKNESLYPSAEKSAQLQDFLTKNNLYRFYKLERARQNLDHFSFVENGILKMNGFDIFNIYLPEGFVEKASKLETVDEEEKKELGKFYIIFKTNEKSQGHPGITHGGLLATIVDSALGQFVKKSFKLIFNYFMNPSIYSQPS